MWGSSLLWGSEPEPGGGKGQQLLDWPALRPLQHFLGVRKAVSGSCHHVHWSQSMDTGRRQETLVWKLQQSAFEKLLSILAPSPGHRAERQCKLQHSERAKESKITVFENVTEILLHDPVPWASPETLVQLQIPLNELESWIEPRNCFSLQVNLCTLNLRSTSLNTNYPYFL